MAKNQQSTDLLRNAASLQHSFDVEKFGQEQLNLLKSIRDSLTTGTSFDPDKFMKNRNSQLSPQLKAFSETFGKELSKIYKGASAGAGSGSQVTDRLDKDIQLMTSFMQNNKGNTDDMVKLLENMTNALIGSGGIKQGQMGQWLKDLVNGQQAANNIANKHYSYARSGQMSFRMDANFIKLLDKSFAKVYEDAKKEREIFEKRFGDAGQTVGTWDKTVDSFKGLLGEKIMGAFGLPKLKDLKTNIEAGLMKFAVGFIPGMTKEQKADVRTGISGAAEHTKAAQHMLDKEHSAEFFVLMKEFAVNIEKQQALARILEQSTTTNLETIASIDSSILGGSSPEELGKLVTDKFKDSQQRMLEPESIEKQQSSLLLLTQTFEKLNEKIEDLNKMGVLTQGQTAEKTKLLDQKQTMSDVLKGMFSGPADKIKDLFTTSGVAEIIKSIHPMLQQESKMSTEDQQAYQQAVTDIEAAEKDPRSKRTPRSKWGNAQKIKQGIEEKYLTDDISTLAERKDELISQKESGIGLSLTEESELMQINANLLMLEDIRLGGDNLNKLMEEKLNILIDIFTNATRFHKGGVVPDEVKNSAGEVFAFLTPGETVLPPDVEIAKFDTDGKGSYAKIILPKSDADVSEMQVEKERAEDLKESQKLNKNVEKIVKAITGGEIELSNDSSKIDSKDSKKEETGSRILDNVFSGAIGKIAAKILPIVKTVGVVAGGALKSVGVAGAAAAKAAAIPLAKVAAVAGTAYVGYKAGEYLGDKMGLSDKASDLVDFFAGTPDEEAEVADREKYSTGAASFRDLEGHERLDKETLARANTRKSQVLSRLDIYPGHKKYQELMDIEDENEFYDKATKMATGVFKDNKAALEMIQTQKERRIVETGQLNRQCRALDEQEIEVTTPELDEQKQMAETDTHVASGAQTNNQDVVNSINSLKDIIVRTSQYETTELSRHLQNIDGSVKHIPEPKSIQNIQHRAMENFMVPLANGFNT